MVRSFMPAVAMAFLAAGCPAFNSISDIRYGEYESCTRAQAKSEELSNYLAARKACAVVADCAAMAAGNKACGGPSMYAVYATNDVDQTYLNALITDLTSWERQCNNDSGIVSTCEVVLEPGLVCETNQCQPESGYIHTVY